MKFSARLFAHAALCSLLVAGCARQTSGSTFSPIPFGPALQSRSADNAAASSLLTWVLGLSDSCPSKRENISVNLAALDSNYQLITGTYRPPIKLIDTDKSGATHLSHTTITRASTKISLSYSGAAIGSFRIIPSVNGHMGTGLEIVPHSTCINAKPSFVKVVTTGKGADVVLAGNAKPPFDLRGVDPSTGLGCSRSVHITKVNAKSYRIGPSSPPAWGACAVFAVGDGGHSKDYFQINVLLIK